MLAQEAPQPFGLLALLKPHAAQLAAQPAIEAAQLAVRACMTEVRHPSGQVGIRLADHLPQADRPVALGDLTQARLGTLEALRRDAKCAARTPPVAEELAFCDWGDGALLLLTRSRKRRSRKPVTEAMTRSPAACDRT